MKPYKKGYLKVGNGHRLYYECCGNQKGIPTVFLHGGPGAGFNEGHKKFFDFKKFNVLFFDQRGAGRSKPFASLESNTTADLVSDLNLLLDYLGLTKVLIFGGSWGSTLALVFAIQNPKRVIGLILRGIFLGNKASKKHYLEGGVSSFAPEAWERFVNFVPASARKNLVDFYYQKFLSKDIKVQKKYAFEWTLYEMSIISLKPIPDLIKSIRKEATFHSLAALECHYIKNNCFIPDDYILNNCSKLKAIPISIVQGNYDLVCPPIGAYQLKQKLKHAKLTRVTAGHSSSEPEVLQALVKELKLFR